ncbi:MAG: hypothetical protein FNP40_15920 [Dehalobacter sp. 4CP]|uniref:hypothetical protein n=1 Tax=Dehalobacter sp. CP TaxID=2594474 RepID=UPI0013C63490|nr:hypothetical protein [Dehalobacter sp. 4CP]
MNGLRGEPMDSVDSSFLTSNKFEQFIRIGDYERNQDITLSIPNTEGVYAVVSPHYPEKRFLIEGTGGFFKRKNPNVPEHVVLKNWVEGTHILYLGKAGGTDKKGKISKAALRDRITTYIKFGYGYDIGHWGGRLIWQLEYSRDLLIYWRICNEGENPVEIEKMLIRDFEDRYGKMPFANLRH